MIRRLAALALALTVTAAAQAAEPRGLGAAFPDLHMVDASGTETHLSTLRPQPVLLVVWAHWCAPCRKEMPSLAALDEQWAKPRGARIVLLSLKPDEFDKDAELARQLTPTLTAVRPRQPLAAAELYALFGSESPNGISIPKTVLLDGDGRVRFLNDGGRDWSVAGPLLDHRLDRAE